MRPLRILVLLDNGFTHDQRVRREVTSLHKVGHQITLLATAAPGRPVVENYDGVAVRREVPSLTLKLRDRGAVSRFAQSLAREEVDVVHCHDHWMLRVGAALKKLRPGVTLIYDSHELFYGWPLNLNRGAGWILRVKSRIARRLAIRREREDASLVDFLITVNESLADALQSHFARRERPIVLRNASRLAPVPRRTERLRERFAIPRRQRILAFVRSRLHTGTLNLERVLQEFRTREDVALVFISGQPLEGNEVVEYARRLGSRNAYFHEAIPPEEVVPTLASADFGLVPTWNRSDLSYWYALDNKLFDYVAAGLPILATAQPEYRRLVEGHGVGVCVNPDEPDAYVRGFDALIAHEATFRAKALEARRRLCWEEEEPRLLDLYRRVGEQPRGR